MEKTFECEIVAIQQRVVGVLLNAGDISSREASRMLQYKMAKNMEQVKTFQ